ncbi:MAG: FAD-binding oxidoreductase [Bacillota bacterium]|jgi:FAD/FMN-containing dehydrogenase
MTAENFDLLKEKLNGRVTDDPFETSFYTRDMASFPGFLVKLMFRVGAELAARPQSEEDVRQLVAYARDNHMAITPRAGGTSAYMNAVPVSGGMVMDLTGLSGLIRLDKERGVAEVWCGTAWSALEKDLNREGFTLCSYPSSAVSSTVGGWFSMEGQGIGSMAWGCFHDLVESAHVILASGEEFDAAAAGPRPLSLFAGKEGTLAIVTRLTFKVVPLAEAVYHVSFAAPSAIVAAKIMDMAEKGPVKPFNGHFADRTCLDFQKRMGYEVPEVSGFLVTLSYRGAAADMAACRAYAETIRLKTGVRLCSDETAAEEWEERLYSLRIKRNGPTLLAAEVILPMARLNDFYGRVKKLRQRVSVYGHMMSGQQANVMAQYYADESQTLRYLFYLAKTKKINDAAIACGGRPYGTGVWNTVYLKRSRDPASLAEAREAKERLDPENRMNPGKFYRPPKLMPPALFGLACFAANLGSRVLRIGRRR